MHCMDFHSWPYLRDRSRQGCRTQSSTQVGDLTDLIHTHHRALQLQHPCGHSFLVATERMASLGTECRGRCRVERTRLVDVSSKWLRWLGLGWWQPPRTVRTELFQLSGQLSKKEAAEQTTAQVRYTASLGTHAVCVQRPLCMRIPADMTASYTYEGHVFGLA
jgi:hypothetical protein